MAEASLKLGGSWATKEGSLLGFNDENGNYKPIPFDFTRATTATRVNRDGLIEEVQSGVPRIDFSGDGSLLLEPQRTNLVTYSEDFSQNIWTKTNATVVSGFVAPDGTTNAYKMTTSANNGQIQYSQASGNSNTKSVSIFAKANTSTSKFKIIEQYYNGHQTLFDLNLGVVEFSNGAGSKIEYYGNGWYKCTHIQSYSSGQNNATFAFRTNVPESLFIWGAQLEVGEYPTSYIPTSGSAVTRNADVCNDAGDSNTFNDSEGVLYAEVDFLTLTGGDYFGLNNGTNNQRVLIQRSTNNIRAFINSAVELTGTTSSLNNKIAVSYKANDYKLYLNGTKVATNTSSSP